LIWEVVDFHIFASHLSLRHTYLQLYKWNIVVGSDTFWHPLSASWSLGYDCTASCIPRSGFASPDVWWPVVYALSSSHSIEWRWLCQWSCRRHLQFHWHCRQGSAWRRGIWGCYWASPTQWGSIGVSTFRHAKWLQLLSGSVCKGISVHLLTLPHLLSPILSYPCTNTNIRRPWHIRVDDSYLLPPLAPQCKGITQTLIPDTSAVKPKVSQLTDGNLFWSVVYISDTACLHAGAADDTQPALANPHPSRRPWPVIGGYAASVPWHSAVLDKHRIHGDMSMQYYGTLRVMWTHGNGRLRGSVLYRTLYLCTRT
jgi:hypothetical protein